MLEQKSSYLIDDQILSHYQTIAKVLGTMFAPVLETVVHDLRQSRNNIMCIYNGHISGRNEGDATTELELMRLKGEVPDHIINFSSESVRGNKLKSSSVAIRNAKRELIGAVCFHLEVSYFSEFGKFIEQFISTNQYSYLNQEKNNMFVFSPKEEIHDAIQDIVIQNSWQGHTLSKRDKKEIVKTLYKNGHFNKRGAVTIIANELKITRPSVYRYLKEGAEVLKVAHATA